MSQAVVTQGDATVSRIEEVLMSGNLANLSPQEKVVYHNRVCESLGLNPLTRPFDYLTLNGKMVLYARKDATDQLRKLNGVSITDIRREQAGDLYIVTASAQDRDGRTDQSLGVVNVKGLAGEALANALMKAETKAKRRVTLSLSGLGLLDETETEYLDMPDVEPQPSRPATQRPPRSQRNAEKAQAVDTVTGEITDAPPPLWTKQELNAGLQAATITVHDLSPILGQPATRENYAELIDTWLFDNPGKRVNDLISAAITHHTGASEPQPALMGD